jgi:glucosamine-phosphate N-acetyltransferase
MQFRELKEQDYKNYKKLIDSDINIDYFKHFIENVLNKNHKLYVLEKNNKIIGTGTVLIEEKLTYGGSKLGHIENILVDEYHRGNGYGEFIVKNLLKICKQENCYRVDLNCVKELENFYSKNNFNQNSISMNIYFKENFK